MERKTESKKSIQREILPIPDKPYSGTILYDAKNPDVKFNPIQPIYPPAGAPNVLIVLIDDLGFGASSAFGGPCNAFTAEKLAAGGLKYNRFHNTALCSPSRAALLTGRNHHSVGMGGITEIATAAPGNTSSIPNSASNIAKILKYNGYSTAQFGKCHEVPVWETSPIGPFDHWPTGMGFEKFYGFVGGETNQWYPEVYDGTTRVEIPNDPDYHFMPDMTEKAIDWVRMQKSLAPEKPFFMYFAPGATHAPHHVPKEWIDKYKGKFDHGWDNQREITFAKQKELGIIPQDTKLTQRHKEIPAWDEMPAEMKPVLLKEIETYAGFLEYTDYHVGKLIDCMADIGVLENTLIYYILGDNGASAEGTINGTFNEMINFNGVSNIETPQFLMEHLDEFGGHNSYNHYSVGWAHSMNTPYQWTKQVASHFGGTRTGVIVHWPAGIKTKSEIRTQFHHLIDILPTILEAADIPHPMIVDGIQQRPIEGMSMLYSFNDSGAGDVRDIQYFEMFGNRGIYYKGWTAVTKHRTPWDLTKAKLVAFDNDNWELYDINKDWSQSEDLSKIYPDKLQELQRLWLIEATRYNVLPMDDRGVERIIAELAGRPVLIKGKSQILFEGMVVNEHSFIDTKNKSYAVTADLEVRHFPAEGVVIAQGANFGGWALYVKNGKLKYIYNFLGLFSYELETDELIPEGHHQVRMEFAYDGGGLGKGGMTTLFIDGKKLAEGRADHTHAMIFSADSVAMVGNKTGAPIGKDFNVSNNRFNGRINWVQVDLTITDSDHYVSHEEKLNVAMAIQ